MPEESTAEKDTGKPKRLRSDAARNRARLLDVAYEAFAADGLAVPIDEIARRAGVGAGTVYRHFPTKEALFQAIITNRMEQLVAFADALAAERSPGDALFGFLAMLVAEGARDQGLVDGLAGVGVDVDDVAQGTEQHFMDALGGLLTRAQAAGAVRPDVDVRDVKTLLVGCQAMQRYSGDDDATGRLLAIIRDGLATPAR